MQRFSYSLALLALIIAARADITATWDGTSGNWTNSSRWSGGVIPNNSAPNFYDAVLNAGTVTLDQPIAINQLTLGGGALNGASTLSLAEGVQWSGGATLALSGNGRVFLGDGSVSAVSGVATFASGTIFGGGGATFTVQPGATFTVLDGANFFAQVSSPAWTLGNLGTLIARNTSGPGFTTMDAVFASTGALRVENTGASHVLSLAGGGTLGGSVFLDVNTALELGGTLAVSAGTTFSGTGTLAVAGTVTLGGSITVPNLAVAVGELRPGAHTLSVTGSASVEDNGALAVELNGTGGGRLAVVGALSVYGALRVTLGAGFTPNVGETFDVLDAASIAGAFASVQLPALPAGRFWRTESLHSDGTLVVSSVPATFATWQAAFGAGGFTADDDGDGMKNGLEYTLGTSPLAGGISPVTASIAANRLRLHFEMPDPGATDITLSVEAANTPAGPWTTIATKTGAAAWTGPAAITLTPAAGGKVTVTVGDIQLTSAAPTRVLRLVAALP